MPSRAPSPVNEWNDETQQFEVVQPGERVFVPIPVRARLNDNVFAQAADNVLAEQLSEMELSDDGNDGNDVDRLYNHVDSRQRRHSIDHAPYLSTVRRLTSPEEVARQVAEQATPELEHRRRYHWRSDRLDVDSTNELTQPHSPLSHNLSANELELDYCN